MGNSRLAMCRPVDDANLPDDIPLDAVPRPMQDDTISRCDGCSIEIWVAPRKLELRKRNVCELACYNCLLSRFREGARLGGVVNLNPNRVERPR